MSRSITTALVAALALGAVAFVAEPAAAMPVAGASTYEAATLAAEQVFFRRGYRGRGFRRGFGFRRPFGYRRYGYRRGGLPGHPIRRILRAL